MSSLVTSAFGLVLALLGLAFLRRHRRTWRERKNDPAVEYGERSYYHRQYRRRMLTSGLLLLLGILIPIGDVLIEQKFPLVTTTLYWIGILLVVLFVLALGVLDFFATGMHTKDAILRIRGERAALEREIEEVRRNLREQSGMSRSDAPPRPSDVEEFRTRHLGPISPRNGSDRDGRNVDEGIPDRPRRW